MSNDGPIIEYCSRIFQIRKTCWSMLEDRGFKVTNENKSETIVQFKETCTDRGHILDPGLLTMRSHRVENEKQRIMVLFCGRKDKFVTDDAKYVFSCIDDEWKNTQAESLTAVVIIHKNLTSYAKRFLVTEHQKRYHGGGEGPRMKIELNIFFEVELVVNITEHEMVPKHRIMSGVEKKKLLQRYKVNDDQLPRILISDPVAKYLGLRRGNVVEITRDSDTAGRYVTYRICL
ncbi:hypothetical protein GUITHDRAFT_163048 [Guillardia theta CCMP2712]|uniref:Uncharacterized protein n=1 Tax=Guillardia theta (strain CCMP2712) TaxID=905079 RepID=L1JCW1_GUITC|nr:hypothetical protein GUITHDRAFT_163048 [Guillardia theta CCMP2712]EKX46336.1 hypothetical protein GUITHDRAFT_163048 [Guillardia theta CCMP2712]|mmetsp:Transcript_39664/g.124649  ORF Transcript_39664/g.124649 Transcript_39664/m.124649 type:complete len:232 (-) Transcript_39664:44-739(-)|eukprot:XP_005833316.1 hypothetical protein GUITHDRAFT_163048 [Guillardia theta CCMP2712]